MNLAPILKRLGLQQQELAAELGVRIEAVSRWANGHNVPAGQNLVDLLSALQLRDPSITLQELMDGDTQPVGLGAPVETSPASGPSAGEVSAAGGSAQEAADGALEESASASTTPRGDRAAGFRGVPSESGR